MNMKEQGLIFSYGETNKANDILCQLKDSPKGIQNTLSWNNGVSSTVLNNSS